MAKFTISWDNSSILTNDNIEAERVVYAISNTQGGWSAWIDNTGITPPNDITDKTIKTATITISQVNTKIRVKVQTICTEGGVIDNDDGPEDGIVFSCLTGTVSLTDTTCTINVNLANTDITKVSFSVTRDSDKAVIVPPTIVARANNAATYTAISLKATTAYTWNMVYYADLFMNNATVTVNSADSHYLGKACAQPFKTNDPPSCDAVTALGVTAMS